MENSLKKFYFQCIKKLQFGQAIYLVGSIEKLGNWKTEKAIRLICYNEKIWLKEIELPINQNNSEEIIEYKFFISEYNYNPNKIIWLDSEIKKHYISNLKDNINNLKIMSFNLRYDNINDGKNNWKYRKELVSEIIRINNPDIVCIQEGLQNQVDFLKKEFMNNYEYYGKGRDYNNTGEQNGIFYNKNKFVNLELDQVWISDTPTVPDSITYGNCCPRIITWLKLMKIEDFLSDKEENLKLKYFVLNTHFDHISEISRNKSSKFLINLVNNLTNQSRDNLILVTGDFNAEDDEECIELIKSEGFISCSDEKGICDKTFHDFTGNADLKIDFIFYKNFVNKPNLTSTYNVIKTKKNLYPSDHFPIQAVIEDNLIL